MVLTFGTAWVYDHLESMQTVANCHKLPNTLFRKKLLSIDQIRSAMINSITLIQDANPSASILLTVSPVRHLKDGLIENSRSKSHLLTAIHQVVEELVGLSYFPSYEIMFDELRDYRFYNSDMIHPNETAIEYIWDKFRSVWLDPNTRGTMKDVDKIQKGLAHKPFNKNSEAHIRFMETIKQGQQRLTAEFPHMTF